MFALRSLLSAPRLAILRRYYYSGWAFLIPYLVVYLLYYATKWPVNAAISNQRPEAGSQMTATWVPCMLHVYWALHAIHVILASFALWSWLASYRSKNQDPIVKCQEPDCATPDLATSDVRPPASGLWPLAIRLAPWALLALLFYIPGVYLEWPSDPWEHLRRINEWRILDTVGAHSSWMKSAYFIPYSLLSWCIGLRQLFWLDFYYTGICLLLCWQYYRFSRACGLGERASMVFVIIQALLFGNNIFSFYRYYGISSSIYAQLGAIALTRIFLEWAARGTKLDPVLRKEQDGAHLTGGNGAKGDPIPINPCYPWLKTLRSLFSSLTPVQTNSEVESSEPISENLWLKTGSENLTTDYADKHRLEDNTPKNTDTPSAPDGRHLTAGFWNPASVLWLLASGFCLLVLTAFNHHQGLAVAGLGIAAIVIWRLIEWKRSVLWWLIGGTIIINALFLALYHRPAIIETYRAQGYLNAWYGFNILDLTSPAGDRMLQIISALGIPSLAATLLLLRQNQFIGWVTLFPVTSLLLPCVSLPLASLLSNKDILNIIVFQRALFATPFALAIIRCATPSLTRAANAPTFFAGKTRYYTKDGLILIQYIFTITAVVTISPGQGSYNRTWHAFHSTSKDLKMLHALNIGTSDFASHGIEKPIITTLGIGSTLDATGFKHIIHVWRSIGIPPSFLVPRPLNSIKDSVTDSLVFIPSYTHLWTPASTDAMLSRHWNAQQVPCDHAGIPEIAVCAQNFNESRGEASCEFILLRPKRKDNR